MYPNNESSKNKFQMRGVAMRTLAAIFMFLFALNVTAVVHAEDGSMRYRQMVENLREQNKERREARDEQIKEDEVKNSTQNTGGATTTSDNR